MKQFIRNLTSYILFWKQRTRARRLKKLFYMNPYEGIDTDVEKMLNDYTLTDEELTKACQHIIQATVIYPYGWRISATLVDGYVCNFMHRVCNLIRSQSLGKHHIDILLGAIRDEVRLSVFMTCKHLTPDQIDIGLNSMVAVERMVAMKHPCCTDAQRVKSHLTGSM